MNSIKPGEGKRPTSSELTAISGTVAGSELIPDKVYRRLTKVLRVALVIGVQSISVWGQSPHVSEPAVNLGDTSFLDGRGGPGFVVEQIGDAGHDGRVMDSAGNAVSDAGAVNSISGLTHVAWLSPGHFLGAWYGVEVVLSAPHINAGVQ